MSKQFWGVIAIIFVIFVGIFALSGSKDNKSGGKANASALSQHFDGKGTTGVTLLEYGDYECPYCGQFYPIVKQVQSQFGDQIKFQFRNYPLVNMHQNAFSAARAAEAASLQGKFWEMHDMLYENQSAWSSASDATIYFKQYAKQIGLNVTKYNTDYASGRINDIINADMAEGNKLGIEGTPTFYLDGKKIEVAQSVDSFAKQINAEIAKKTGSKTPADASTSTTDTPATTPQTTGNDQ